MNPVIKAQVHHFKETNSIPNYTENDYFESYAIFAILNGLLGENVDAFKAHLKGSEFGLDGACTLVHGQLAQDADEVISLLNETRDSDVEFYFFQVKSGTHYDYGEISKFFDAVYGFFSQGMKGESGQLDDIIDAKDEIFKRPLKRNPRLSCFFITVGSYQQADRIQTLVDTQRTRLRSLNLFSSVDIQLLGASELQEAYRAATSSNACEIEFPSCQTLPSHPKVEQAYIGYIRAGQLLRLATRNSEGGDSSMNPSIFFDNVRDFDPGSTINQTIINDLNNGDKRGFVFRNNGVTVIARRVNRTGDRFALEDYQIVNGCQTTNILFQCRNAADDVFVPFRLIESKDENFVTSIIVGTNTQNQVKDEQFWALRPFLKDLEEYCKQQPSDLKVYVERRENQYRAQPVERTRIIKPSELMKAIAATFLFQPHRAARDFRRIRSEYKDKIFLGSHSVVPYHLACLANYRFEFFVRNKRIASENRLYKYYVLCALGFTTCRRENIFECIDRKQKEYMRSMEEILFDESRFLSMCFAASNLIDGLARERIDTAYSRERLRDALRTEGFSNAFKLALAQKPLVAFA